MKDDADGYKSDESRAVGWTTANPQHEARTDACPWGHQRSSCGRAGCASVHFVLADHLLKLVVSLVGKLLLAGERSGHLSSAESTTT
jgi:hypothetical protein